MAKKVRKVVKVDKTTMATTRGKFARICEERDLVKLLIPGVKVRPLAEY